MKRAFTRISKPKIFSSLGLLAIIGIVLALLPACTKQASVRTTTAADDFNRANGRLGAGWTDMPGGRLVISSRTVAGTSGGAAPRAAGAIWTSDAFTSDQYSQVQVTAAQPTGSQWIGSAVRAQGGGQNAYVGIYSWNDGSPELKLYLKKSGIWSPLGGVYNSGPLAAGTKLKLMAVGNTLSFQVNGVQRISAADSTLSGGAPGIMAYGAAGADNWAGGDADRFQASYLATDAQGIRSYNMISDNNGYGSQLLRVLPPAKPAPGVTHNFLVVLRVNPGTGATYGDGLGTMATLDAQDRYNLTIVEPTFTADPWVADSPHYPYFRYETFLTRDLVPWIKHNLATTGHEQIWLIGFSKSGLSAQDLILRHPSLFTLAASWDFPAAMSSYDQLDGAAVAYGTEANFQANYRLTAAFLNARKQPFLGHNRIWIGGYSLFKNDISAYAALLTSAGMAHTTGTPLFMAHSWGSGWIPNALAALYQDSIKLPAKP
jgi:Putative esterase